ncbi:type I-E CRISPR-associated endoribonuclease Cas2e [Methanomassiliicoccales archaeon LGM-DZ1]|nr:type I-E CRISPR-associated endoribonuclease Cas2e [Methanomassiliicoccales archaeon LGM-DZ1]
MIVIVLSKSPTASVRGDLTKWLFEIAPNVFAGKLTPRVRDKLWDRVVYNSIGGRAIMAYSTPSNEQGIAFRVYNSEWKIQDFDGVQMMMRPDDSEKQTD